LPQHLIPTIYLHDSPLSKDIQEYKLSRKFLTSTFDSYTGASNPIQHIRHFQDKMMFYFHNDWVMCLTFPSSLRGATSEWFYSLPPRSLHKFTEVTEAFLTQYATRQEAKRSGHHLLSVKMRPGDSFKFYINFFQSQLTKVSNCDEKVYALAFISGLQVTHPLYKHLLKHVTKMSEALSGAQSYIQLREAMKASSNNSAKPSDDGTKLKSIREAPDHAPDRHRVSLLIRS